MFTSTFLIVVISFFIATTVSWALGSKFSFVWSNKNYVLVVEIIGNWLLIDIPLFISFMYQHHKNFSEQIRVSVSFDDSEEPLISEYKPLREIFQPD